jgi:hypothetical protein
MAHARMSAFDHVVCFERYVPDNVYVYHRITDPVTPALVSADWHLILFTSTALGVRTFRPKSLFDALSEEWRFLRDCPAQKFIFPQDEPFHVGTLDDWFADIPNVTVFSIMPEHKAIFYPKLSAKTQVQATYTGYVDDSKIEEYKQFSLPFDLRTRTIGQRVTLYPERGGGFARLKGMSALAVRAEAARRRINHDISVDDADALHGAAWYRFMGDCRFFLGSESGLGLMDRYGTIADRITAYKDEYPRAGFEEIRKACWTPDDEKLSFRGMSPRTLEAALMNCCQVSVEGDYHGLIRPHEHYIPLREDLSNFDEVFEALNDLAGARRRIAACREALIENPALRYSSFAKTIIAMAKTLVSDEASRRTLTIATLAEFRARHQREMLRRVAARAEKEGFRGIEIARRVGLLQQGQIIDHLMAGEKEAHLASELRRLSVEHDFALGQIQGSFDKLSAVREELSAVREELSAVREELIQQSNSLESRGDELRAEVARLRSDMDVIKSPRQLVRKILEKLAWFIGAKLRWKRPAV